MNIIGSIKAAITSGYYGGKVVRVRNRYRANVVAVRFDGEVVVGRFRPMKQVVAYFEFPYEARADRNEFAAACGVDDVWRGDDEVGKDVVLYRRPLLAVEVVSTTGRRSSLRLTLAAKTRRL